MDVAVPEHGETCSEDVAFQPGRLRIDVDRRSSSPATMTTGIFKFYVLVAEVKCIWNHECRLRG